MCWCCRHEGFTAHRRHRAMDFYTKISKTDGGGRPPKDYGASLDMAKQVCMVQRAEAVI